MTGMELPSPRVLSASQMVEHGARSHKPIAWKCDPLVAGGRKCALSD